jgi:hypothetical protein
MKFHAIAPDAPDTHDETAVWLERHLAGMDLPELVAELAAVYDPSRPEPGRVAQLLGSKVDAVLSRGLRSLTASELRPFLMRPFLLFELQVLVLARGGPYWRGLESTVELRARVEGEWKRQKKAADRPSDTAPLVDPRPRSGRLVLPAVCLAVGALLGFLACYLWLAGPVFPPNPHPQQPPPAPTAWGWNKPEAVDKADTPQAYLNRLADLADEWSQVAPPPDAPDRKRRLVVRLLELRSGCTRLSLTDHPLPADLRDGLQLTAAAWCGEIDVLIDNVQKAGDLRPWTPAVEEQIRRMAGDLRAGRIGKGEKN